MCGGGLEPVVGGPVLGVGKLGVEGSEIEDEGRPLECQTGEGDGDGGGRGEGVCIGDIEVDLVK